MTLVLSARSPSRIAVSNQVHVVHFGLEIPRTREATVINVLKKPTRVLFKDATSNSLFSLFLVSDEEIVRLVIAYGRQLGLLGMIVDTADSLAKRPKHGSTALLDSNQDARSTG